MRKAFAKHVLCAGLCAAAIGTTALAAHSAMAVYAAESSSATDTEADKKQPPEDDGSVMAKVTSINGNTLTVQTAQKPGSGENQPAKPADGQTPPEKPADGQTPPEKPADGETPPEKPADGQTPPEKPADGQTPPEKPADDASKPADDGKRPEMSFDGDTLTVTLTSSTEYTTRGNSSVSKSDISKGSVLRLTLDGTTVTRVDIMNE